MDENDRELANRLFVAATAMLEDAIELAVAGQSAKAEPAELALLGRQLQEATRGVAIIAEAAAILANPGAKSLPRKSSQKP